MALVNKNFSDIVTFTRASSATYFDSTGTLQTAANNAPRLDFDPSTLAARGLLIEEQRTNSLRNNTMVGAVAGSPGTRPTNWASSWTSSASGLQLSISGVGTENGVSYVDVNVSGTSTATTPISLLMESTTQIAAAPGQTWTQSSYVKVVSGALGNLVLGQRISERDGAGAQLVISSIAAITPTGNALQTQRYATTYTLVNASTAFITPQFHLAGDGVSTYNVTLRIGLPQLEQGAFATSVIATSGAAATRAADVATINALSPWFNATTGTFLLEVAAPQSVGGSDWIIHLDDGSTNNRIADTLTATGTGASRSFVSIGAGGAGLADMSSGPNPYVLNSVRKIAHVYASGDYAQAVNGGTVQTSTQAGVPTGMTTLRLGQRAGVGAGVLNGWIRKITYYPARLTNAQLQSLTS